MVDGGDPMTFLKDFLINLALLVGLGVVLLLVFPDMMKQVYEALGLILGPIAILFVIVIALPQKRRNRR